MGGKVSTANDVDDGRRTVERGNSRRRNSLRALFVRKDSEKGVEKVKKQKIPTRRLSMAQAAKARLHIIRQYSSVHQDEQGFKAADVLQEQQDPAQLVRRIQSAHAVSFNRFLSSVSKSISDDTLLESQSPDEDDGESTCSSETPNDDSKEDHDFSWSNFKRIPGPTLMAPLPPSRPSLPKKRLSSASVARRSSTSRLSKQMSLPCGY